MTLVDALIAAKIVAPNQKDRLKRVIASWLGRQFKAGIIKPVSEDTYKIDLKGKRK